MEEAPPKESADQPPETPEATSNDQAGSLTEL